MNKTNLTSAAIAIAMAIPVIVTPAASLAETSEAQPASPPVLLAQATKLSTGMAITPANAKRELLAELSRLTPEQKRKIGAARINKVSQFSGAELVSLRCFTNGVGCTGTSGFTQGVICCALRMKANTN